VIVEVAFRLTPKNPQQWFEPEYVVEHGGWAQALDAFIQEEEDGFVGVFANFVEKGEVTGVSVREVEA
jgi:hypothetical protein